MNISPTTVVYKHTNKAAEANEWLKAIERYDVIGCDFETAVKYTAEQKELLKKYSEDENLPYLERKAAEATLAATALDHPAHCVITHCSIAVSDSESVVFVLDNAPILRRVLNFLVTTKVKQVWHNATYDFRHIYYHTDKMPIDYEDTMIFARTLFNHVDKSKARVGLKELAGFKYGAWGLSSDDFVTENMYDPKMLLYAATDPCATLWLYNRMMEATSEGMDSIRSTSDLEYSPWDQLASAPSPKGAKYPEAYFYHNTAKFLVRDTVRLMSTGLPIDLQEVSNLEEEIDSVLDDVHKDLSENVYVQRYMKIRHDELLDKYKATQKAKCKTSKDFLKEFDPSSAVHRSYYMNIFAQRVGLDQPEDQLPTGVPKWSARLVKTLSKRFPPLVALVDKSVPPTSPTAVQAMQQLAEDKARMYNKNYLALIETPKIKLNPFNPGSANQKRELMAMVGVESGAKSDKTGNDSWNREQIERVNKVTEDEDLRAFTQLLIDYSYAAIIKSTFIPAFYRYSLDGVLYGNYNLFGAKSYRFTSNNPNMLNMPSSGSRFSKPVKKCFTAPEGFIVATIDYMGLEDRVIANLSEDSNKLNVFLKNVDAHSQAACFYWPEEAKQHLGEFEDLTAAAIEFKRLVDASHSALKELRNRGKRISFGLAYGCGAPKVSSAAKISIEEANKIFNAYHKELYPGVTEYRENYVLKTAKEQGYIHLGLGARIYTDAPDRDIRTLNNATCQFWSILSLLTINKLHQLIVAAGYEKDIFVTSSIYDSVYLVVRDDPKIIKWLNDVIVPVMETKYMAGQILDNSVDLEIGPAWDEVYTLPHNASVDEIKEIRNKW